MMDYLEEAIKLYQPKSALLLFSGGHDSLVSTHISANYLDKIGLPYQVYHGDTGIGIPASKRFVKDVCARYGWSLQIRSPKAGEKYEDFVRRFGFPGPPMHPMIFRWIKERPLKRYVTHSVKSRPTARENILLITGVRKSESVIRMGYKDAYRKEDSRIWLSPLFDWTEQQCQEYMQEHELPRNWVKDLMGISGECLCGCFTNWHEWTNIVVYFPDVATEILRLWDIAKEVGNPWPWASNPKRHRKQNPPGQQDLFMCARCEAKYNVS